MFERGPPDDCGPVPSGAYLTVGTVGNTAGPFLQRRHKTMFLPSPALHKRPTQLKAEALTPLGGGSDGQVGVVGWRCGRRRWRTKRPERGPRVRGGLRRVLVLCLSAAALLSTHQEFPLELIC